MKYTYTIKSDRRSGERCEVCGLPVVAVRGANYCIVTVLAVTALIGSGISLVLAAVLGVAL